MTDEELAGGYVIGTLAGAERHDARVRAIEDSSFGTLVAAWEERLAPLAVDGEAALPQGLYERIAAVIDASGVEMPGTLTRRAGTGAWTAVSPGLRIKVLNEIAALGRQTFMAELSPGAQYADHDHPQDEEIYMISGDLIIGNVVLGAGDFHIARAGRHHPMHRSLTGCLCIISQAMGPV